MYQEITQSQFIDAFRDYNREDNFSYEGLCALYDWLHEVYEGSKQGFELDVIGLCCEFSEYSDIDEIAENYANIETLDDLWNYTCIIEFNGGIIIQDF